MDTKIIELREAAKAFPSTSRDVQLSAKSEVLRLSELIDAELASLRAAVAERDAAIARAVADERESCAIKLESLADQFERSAAETNHPRLAKSSSAAAAYRRGAAAIRARCERKERERVIDAVNELSKLIGGML